MRIIVIVHPFNKEKYLKFDMVKLKIHSPNLTEKKEMLELPLFSQFAVQSLKRTTKSKKACDFRARIVSFKPFSVLCEP